MTTIGEFFRTTCRLVITIIFGLGAALLLNLVMLLANYLSLELSFEALGLDSTALADNKLLGVFFTSLVPGATLTSLYAFGLAGVVCLGYFICTHLFIQLFDYFKNYRLHRRAGNETQAEAFLWLIGKNLLYLVVFLPLVFVFSTWDLELFRFRAVMGATQAVKPNDVLALPTWASVQKDGVNFYAITLVRIGMWGYISVNVMAAVVLEWMIDRVREQFVAMWSELARLFDDGNDTASLVTEAGSAAAGEESVADIGEAPSFAGSEGSATHEEPPVEGIHGDAPSNAQPTPGVRESDLKDVLGGAPDERVSVEDALRDSDKYHVEISTGRVWSRRYWQQLHAPQEAEYEGAVR